ncbi:MAG: PhoH family protein, partial [Acidimicrobiia bacterium]|nr:PhoH family protein [Acidimicrobiia bacterium]
MLDAPASGVRLRVPSNHLMLELVGEHDVHLRVLERAFPDVRIVVRGNEILISGEPARAAEVKTVAEELLILVQEGESLDADRVDRVIQMVGEDVPSPSGVLTDGVPVGRGKMVRPKTVGQHRYIDAIRDNTLVFSVGPAGTGKTYLAMAAAVETLSSGAVRRIILTRPAVEAGESLGFLPGDLIAKIDPYLRPLYDALYEMMGFDKVNRLIERNVIEVAPLAFMRGRTLNESFVILDEAQNTSIEQMKMFLTRIGFGTTAVVTGDITQVDLPKGVTSGLRHAIDMLSEVEGVQFTFFQSRDVVRHPLVKRIIDAYESRGGGSA